VAGRLTATGQIGVGTACRALQGRSKNPVESALVSA
jgi:hypothetical protein